MNTREKDNIQQLVGTFTDGQLNNLTENLESYLHPDISLFVPVYRYCDYAVSENHSHPSYSFIYNINQKSKILVDGHLLPPPSDPHFISVFSPGVKHQEIVEEGFSNYIAVFIRKDWFENIMQHYQTSIEKIYKGDCYASDENILYMLKLLMLEHNAPPLGNGQFIHTLNQLIAHQFARLLTGTTTNFTAIDTSGKVDKAIAFMHEHIDEKINISHLANLVYTSSSHFSKIFKAYTSKTPIEYLSRIRIEKSKRLLKHSDKNLTEIAFDCGFSSSSYFSNCFIESVKITPSEYRKKFQAKENTDKIK